MDTVFGDTAREPTQTQVPVRDGRAGRIWPSVVIVFGLVLTGAWVCLLGYGLVLLVEAAI